MRKEMIMVPCSRCGSLQERTLGSRNRIAVCFKCKGERHRTRTGFENLKNSVRNRLAKSRAAVIRAVRLLNITRANAVRTRESRQETMRRVNEGRMNKPAIERSLIAQKAAQTRIKRHGTKHLKKNAKLLKMRARKNRRMRLRSRRVDKGGLTFAQRSALGKKAHAAFVAKYGIEVLRERARKAALAKKERLTQTEVNG